MEAFFRASRGGDFEALLEVLDPDVGRPARRGGTANWAARNGWISGELRGARAVAQRFAGQAQGAAYRADRRHAGHGVGFRDTPRVVFAFTVRDGKVVEIELVADRTGSGGSRLEMLG